MAKLIFLLDGNVIKEYMLDKERMTVGRRASNDIQIDNLAISGEHAAVVTIGQDAYIEDLDSTNGTLVNKKPIKKYLLKHGDVIGLGKYQLKYLNVPIINKPHQPGFEDTVLVAPKSTDKKKHATPEIVAPSRSQTVEQAIVTASDQVIEEAHSVSAKDVVPAASVIEEATPEELLEQMKQGPRLQILNGDNAGNALLLDKSMVKVGQANEQVAVVTKREKGYFLTHVAGNNYPIVNGKQIGAQAYALNNHDQIEVLDVKMELRLD